MAGEKTKGQREAQTEWGVIRFTTKGSRCPTEGQRAPSQQEHQEGVSAGLVPLAPLLLSPHLPRSGIWFPPFPEAPCKTAHPPGPFYLSRVHCCGTPSPTPVHAWGQPMTPQRDRQRWGWRGQGDKGPKPRRGSEHSGRPMTLRHKNTQTTNKRELP